jgi:hypothetical protein
MTFLRVISLISFTGMNSDLTISFVIEKLGCNVSGSIILSDPVLMGGDILISEISLCSSLSLGLIVVCDLPLNVHILAYTSYFSFSLRISSAVGGLYHSISLNQLHCCSKRTALSEISRNHAVKQITNTLLISTPLNENSRVKILPSDLF